MGNLVSIKEIKEIYSIQNDSDLVCYTLDNWFVIDKKGLYNKGERCYFITEGSFIPFQLGSFKHLNLSYKDFNNGNKGFAVKTIKVRGIISQGFLLKMDTPFVKKKKVSLDEKFGVKKYDPKYLSSYKDLSRKEKLALFFYNLSRGFFKYTRLPSFIKNEEIPKIQDYQDFSKLRGSYFEVKELLDGEKVYIYYKNGNFGVCSSYKEIDLTDESNSYTRVITPDVIRNLKLSNADKIIEGTLNQNEIYVDSLCALDREVYLNNGTFDYTVSDLLKLKKTPIIEPSLKFVFENIHQILFYAEGLSALVPSKRRKGLVFYNGGKPVFKVESNVFKLERDRLL